MNQRTWRYALVLMSHYSIQFLPHITRNIQYLVNLSQKHAFVKFCPRGGYRKWRHVTHDCNQSALSLFVTCRAPADLHAAPSGGGLQSASVDHLGDVFGRVGSESSVGEPLAQLGDTQLTLCRQRCRLGAVDVRMIAVVVVPCREDRHGASWQRPWTTSTAAPTTPTLSAFVAPKAANIMVTYRLVINIIMIIITYFAHKQEQSEQYNTTDTDPDMKAHKRRLQIKQGAHG